VKFKFTILNVTAILFIACCIVYTIVNYAALSHAEGWGVVLMIGLIGYGLSALLVDLIIRFAFKKNKYQHLISAVVTILYFVILLAGFWTEP
jgi:uncharacterized PurR-regulated membrane protein YhhQ (DUF165 family)